MTAVLLFAGWALVGYLWARWWRARRRLRELRRFIDERFTADDLDALRRAQAMRRQRERRHLS